MNAAQERAEIIRNAEAAYRVKEPNVTAEFLLLLRRVTAKYLPKNRIKVSRTKRQR